MDGFIPKHEGIRCNSVPILVCENADLSKRRAIFEMGTLFEARMAHTKPQQQYSSRPEGLVMAKLAAVTMPLDPRNKAANFAKMADYVREAAAQGGDLILFPEGSLTGLGTEGMYRPCGEDRIFMLENGELVPEGESTQAFIALAQEHDIYICWGMAEIDPDWPDVTYNCMVLVGPEGYVGKYRKVHLPLCEKFMHYPGRDGYPVFDTRIGRIGLEVCYDICFPEVARSLALQGAQIILSQTGWPNITGTEEDPDHIVIDVFHRARANENMVVVVNSNVCGEAFNGYSKIYGPTGGRVYAETGSTEGMAIAEVDVEGEINHGRIFAMGGCNLIKDRKPGSYSALVEDSRYCPEYGATM